MVNWYVFTEAGGGAVLIVAVGLLTLMALKAS
jgi:hypothetical protein